MAYHSKTAFTFGPEFRAKLRDLRKRRGLTLRTLALLRTNRLVTIADEHGTDSPEWKAEVEATVPKLHDPKVAREAAVMIADVFNRWKSTLPPRPGAV